MEASVGQLFFFFLTSMAREVHYLKLAEEKVVDIVVLHVYQPVGRSVGTGDSRLQSVSFFLFISHMHLKPTVAAETLRCGGIRVAFYLALY